MKYFEFELNGETIKLRLTTENSQLIEKKTGKGLFDLVQEINVSNIVTLLMYLRRGEVPQFSEKDTFALCDKLIDNGYTYERIMMEVIFEALVVSGFLSKEQLEEAKTLKEEVKKSNKKKVLEDLQN
jgi:hypothetical protein